MGHVTDLDGWTGCTVILCPEGSDGGVRGPRRRSRHEGERPALARGERAGGQRDPAHGRQRLRARRGRRGRRLARRAGSRLSDTCRDRAARRGGRGLRPRARRLVRTRPGPEEGYAACIAAGAGRRARNRRSRKRLHGRKAARSGVLDEGRARLRRPHARRGRQGRRDRRRERVRRGASRTTARSSRASGAMGAYAERSTSSPPASRRSDPWRESTTLACVLTDARLTKTQAWLVARAASAGVARAVDPAATAVDGDVVYCVATGPYRPRSAHGRRSGRRCRRRGDPGRGPAGERRARLPGGRGADGVR